MDTNINASLGANKELPKTSKWVKGSVVLAIVIVMNLFFNYALSLVYQEPVYDQFINQSQVVEQISTKEKCLEVGGQWTADAYPEDMKGLTKPAGYCNANFTNQKSYESAMKVYDRNVFVTLVILGVLVLVIGAFVKVGILSLAFSWGGVLSLVIASMRYWGSADKLIKVLILALALCSLIWLAVKKFSK